MNVHGFVGSNYSCGAGRIRVVEDYLMLLLDKLRKAQPGEDLTRCLPCYLTA